MSKNIYVWPALFMLDLRGNVERCLEAMPNVIKDAAAEYKHYDRFELDYFGDFVTITEKIDIEVALKHFGELWKRYETLYDLKQDSPTENQTLVKHKGALGERVDTAAKRAYSEAREYVNEYRKLNGEVGLFNIRHIFVHNDQEFTFNPWKEGEAERMTEAFFAVIDQREEAYQQSEEGKKAAEKQKKRQETATEMVENIGAFFEMDEKEKMAWIREFLELIDYRSTEIDYEKIRTMFRDNGFDTRAAVDGGKGLVDAWSELKTAYVKYMSQRFLDVLNYREKSAGSLTAGTGVPPVIFDQLHRYKDLG